MGRDGKIPKFRWTTPVTASLIMSVKKFILTTKNTPAHYNESLLAGQATSSIVKLINYGFAGVDIISLPNFDFGCILHNIIHHHVVLENLYFNISIAT